MRYSFDWLTPDIERIQDAHQRRMAALYAGQPPDDVIAVAGAAYGHSHGLAGAAAIDMLALPDDWLADVFDDMAARAALAADPVTYRPLTIEPDAYGVHYIDALFGAAVYIHGGQTWSDELTGDVADLAMPDLARCAIFQSSLDLARRAVAASRAPVFVTTPVLSCPVNIAINLFGERWLEALVERPEAARRALRIIADVIVACARAFFDVIPPAVRRTTVASSRYAPAGYGFIDGCSTQLVSGRHYRDWIAPLDADILALSPNGGMIHLCGAHAQHLPAWRAMPQLRSVQINDRATDDLPLYLAGLRADQILYVAPTERMPAERVVEMAGSRPLVLACELSRPLPGARR